MRPSKEQIEEIADLLDCGMRCYYNLKTGEIRTIINFDTWDSADEELWEEEIKEIEENRSDYFMFEGFETYESFRLMADFVGQIDDAKFQDRLIEALNRPKPFSNFKWLIENSGAYRQQWFDYKKMRYIQWVKDQTDLIKEDLDE